MQHTMSRSVLRILVVVLVMLAAVATWLLRPRQIEAPGVATVFPRSLALPDVQFVDDAGHPSRIGALRGNFSFLFFGFTHCPDVCPLTLQVLATARTEIEARRPEWVPEVVFVSVDPHRDTPERIRSYLENFDPEFLGVTASEQTLAPLLKTLGVYTEKPVQPGETYNVAHTSAIYLIGPQAELIALSSWPHDAATIATDYLRIRELGEFDGGHEQ